MNIVEFYRSFLHDNHVIEKQEGTPLFIAEQNTPITIGKKQVVLPTDEVLKSFNDNAEDIQVFHPLSENTLRKDSIVFNFLKRLTRTALTIELDQLFIDIISYVNNVELSKNANKKQRDIIKHLVDVDDKSLEHLKALSNKIDPNGENKLIDFTIIRGGTLDDTKYSRICHLHLPLYHELHGDNATRPFGVKLRKKDVALLIALHQVVFGDLLSRYDGSSAVVYSYGTLDVHAPNFTSLACAFNEVKTAYRRVISAFKKQFTEYPYMEGLWYQHLDKIQKYRALVPALPGNDGEVSASEDNRRKTLQSQPKPRVTPLGTVKEINKVEVKENLNEPMSYTDVLKLREARKEENARKQRERGYSYTRDDEDDGYRRNRWDRYDRDRYNDIDVSDVDENYRRDREDYARPGRGYRHEERDRYSRYSSPNIGSTRRIRSRY